jgi:glyoxylase I family protein
MPNHRGLLHHLIIRVSNVTRSSLFYGPVFRYLGYELAGLSDRYEDWKRWDLDTPHEISIVQADLSLASVRHVRGAVGQHDHLAFCAESREDVDRFYVDVLVGLEKSGLCAIEDPPCDCPEYGEGYYATFFTDPDGLKYEFVINPNFLKAKRERVPN